MKSIFKLALGSVLAAQVFAASPAFAAAEYSPDSYMSEGIKFEKRGQYYQAARYYFQALQRANSQSQKGMAYAAISNALIAQGLPQSASYFFLKAISSGNDRAVRQALAGTQALVDNVGGILFKKYALKYTKEDQYPQGARDYYLYFLAQEHLQNQRPNDVIRVVNGMDESFPNYPEALFLRGTAQLMIGYPDGGVNDFKACAKYADSSKYTQGDTPAETREMKNRCLAGVGRAYYQSKDYTQAEQWYDQIDVASMEWPQVQYERAWAAVARGDYNRSLGRLVSYRSPGLAWFHDSEVEMLRAVSWLQMCIYDEVDKESKDFMIKYGKVGQDIKVLLDSTRNGSTNSLIRMFQRGMEALNNKVQSENPMHQVMNRFVRSPYFVSLVQTGSRTKKEMNYLNSVGDAGRQGLGGFLRDVLSWRWNTAQEAGGIFVRDRLATEYKVLLSNVSTIDIVKLEMLRRSRSQVEQLATNVNAAQDVWGNKKRGSLGRPPVRNDQYFWNFNGEFWADELGDYTFAMRPECY